MADTMRFELVSPEKRLAAIDARSAQIPGMEGDFTAMPQHAPLVSTLRPGLVTVVSAEGETQYFVTGGFAEVTGEATTVLAESAVARGDLDPAFLDAQIEAAEARAEEAEGDSGLIARQRLMDLREARQLLG